MTVKQLIDKLKEFPDDLPICIDEYMGFVEANENCIKVEKRKYVCFPFTQSDEFEYVNLKGTKFDI